MEARKQFNFAFFYLCVCALVVFGIMGMEFAIHDGFSLDASSLTLILGILILTMAVVETGGIRSTKKAVPDNTLDTLTGQANRTGLRHRLAELIHQFETENKSFALLLMDLDRFKEINNTLGHHIGDQLLQRVATRIEGITPEAIFHARLGGDEFAVIVPNCEAQRALMVAHNIQNALEKPVAINNVEIDIRSSIGIALFPQHGNDAEVLFRHAEVAMYTAKKRGTAPTTYSANLDSYNLRRLALTGELRNAIENRQMILHYQPKIDLTNNHTVGVEALVRWMHPQHGMIPPGEFISLAEQNDVIRKLTYWVIDEALLQCHAWRQMGYSLNVAINLSARNLHDPGLPAKIAGLLAKWAIPSSFLTLEITENAIMIDPERALKILLRLHDLGIHLSIDDFGTGYSSLVYLKKLPVSQIKVDRSFVMDMTQDDDDAAIVRSTIDLGHHMDCQVVAEGVENKDALEQLRSLGCDLVQGYYLSRPLPAEDVTAWFSESPWGIMTPATTPFLATQQKAMP